MRSFKSFVAENSLLDAHLMYHELGIPLPDVPGITEYPGGGHGYPTGPNTFCIHSRTPGPAGGATIAHYKSTPAGDVLHNDHDEAFKSFQNGKQVSKNGYFLNGSRVWKEDLEKAKHETI